MTQRALSRSSKYANMRYRKNQMLLIHNQNKKIQHTILETFTKKIATKFKVAWWVLWIVDPRNFLNSFFNKNYYLNLNFFLSFAECSPQKWNKKWSQKVASHIKLFDIARDRRETLKKEKEKRKMRKSQTIATNTFVLLLFCVESFIFC